MDDIRDTRPWFWILLALVFAVAIYGLVVALSANSSSVDEKKVVKEATAEIREELEGLNGALKAADEFQEESSQLAQQDQRRIKRQVNVAVAGGQKELDKVKGRVASLEGEMSESQDQTVKLKHSVFELNVGEEEREAEIVELEERVNKLQRQSGG
ncbi:MAG: hypothetical protein H0X42_06345 [Solirubrobacterales bacterium]|nr:hypothetical protein [Solirubrobacterales bacterium]